MPIESVMLSNLIILCHPLLLLPSIFPSIRIFSNVSVLHIRWPKYWSFIFSISPFNENSGLISFRNGLIGSLCCPRTLKSLIQHHSSKHQICSALFQRVDSHISNHFLRAEALSIRFIKYFESLL